MKLITVHLPEYFIEGLHELVRQKKYPHRSEIIRNAIRDLLKKELVGFIPKKNNSIHGPKCSKCGALMYLAKEEGVYFCAACKSFFSPVSL